MKLLVLCQRRFFEKYDTHLPAYEDGTECSETSTYKIQTPGNYQEESIQQYDTSFILVSRKILICGPKIKIFITILWCKPATTDSGYVLFSVEICSIN
jgi:hypothetical protein